MSSSLMLLSLTMILTSFTLMYFSTFISIEIPILSILQFNIPISILMDWMSMLFLFTVIFISSMILKFSMFYIPQKEHKQFSLILITFVISMIFLIMSDNIIFIMLGWDGLGLSSFILVIYYQNPKSSSSGWITILSNRMGDIFILISIALLISSMNWNFSMNSYFLMFPIILLSIAAFTKSAQFPFSAWLPAAMAAPTPISALVHSSTLVTAGVFLLIRLTNFPNPTIMMMILITSTLTTLFASLSAHWEQDMKKIIALSTLSQIAIMMFAISINAYNSAFFHLVTHAFFKSTMFLCAGVLIHHSSYQDMRHISPFYSSSPLTLTALGTTSLALMGMPFLSGFFSKDAIIEHLMSNNLILWLSLLMIFSISLTSSYSLRMMYNSIKPTPNSPSYSTHLSNHYSISIFLLIPMSIFTGASLSWIQFPLQLFILPTLMKILILTSLILGISIGFSNLPNSPILIKIGEIPMSLWFSNFFSSSLWSKINFPSLTSQKNDKTWQEILGPQKSFSQLSTSSSMPDLISHTSLFLLILSLFIPILLLL